MPTVPELPLTPPRRWHALTIVGLLALVVASPALAWNGAGHRLTAVLAWRQLAPAERAELVALLEAHPEADRWERQVGPGHERGMVLLAAASTWADDIRRDPRFYDETSEPAQPTLPGYPDMARRLGWHYVNQPLDAARSGGRPTGELDRQIRRLGETLADPRQSRATRAYALVWLVHLVGDLHQPLHVVTRHNGDGSDDAGGNGVALIDPANGRRPETNLHAWWDDLPGPPWLRGTPLLAVADRLARLPLAADDGRPDIGRWRAASVDLARRVAYALPAGAPPMRIDEDYRRRAQAVADEQIALAGRRLAQLLSALLAAGKNG